MSLWAVLDAKKKLQEEQAKEDALREQRMREQFGWGNDLYTESRKARDNGTADVLSYQKYVWSVARGAEDKSLRPDAVKIAKRLNLSSVAINFDLSEAKRFVAFEQYMATTDKAPLTAAHTAALQKMTDAEAAWKKTIEEYNDAYRQLDAHTLNARAYSQSKVNNIRLFADEEVLDDGLAVRDTYLLSGMPA